MKVRKMGEDDNDKYGPRDRSGNPIRMLAVYFGLDSSASASQGLPLPVSIQEAGKRPFNAGACFGVGVGGLGGGGFQDLTGLRGCFTGFDISIYRDSMVVGGAYWARGWGRCSCWNAEAASLLS